MLPIPLGFITYSIDLRGVLQRELFPYSILIVSTACRFVSSIGTAR